MSAFGGGSKPTRDRESFASITASQETPPSAIRELADWLTSCRRQRAELLKACEAGVLLS
jgi:hypothetical protein